MEYHIQRTLRPSSLHGEWDCAAWSNAAIGEVQYFLPQSSGHHPRVQFRMLYDDAGVYLIFRVEDRYVRSVITEFNGSVCTDSCTEFFVQPCNNAGYFNFEVNCGGTLLASYIEDPTRDEHGFKKSRPLTPADAALVRIYHSMPVVVEPEVQEPTVWVNELFIPFALFERYVGPLDAPTGQQWRANFYKCADHTSHPHWATWSPVKELNFHQPQYFAPLFFA